MSDQTIHTGKRPRGLIIAFVVLALFVGGIAMLGNGSTPQDGAEGTTAASE